MASTPDLPELMPFATAPTDSATASKATAHPSVAPANAKTAATAKTKTKETESAKEKTTKNEEHGTYLTTRQKLDHARVAKDKANAAFTSGNIQEALRLYYEGLLYASGINGFDAQFGRASEPEAKEGVTLVNTLNCNLAACFLKQHKWERAIAVTTRVIKSDAQHTKALYRRAVARIAIGDIAGAEIDALGALDLNPDDTAVKQMIKEIRAKHKAAEEKQKKELSGFLNK